MPKRTSASTVICVCFIVLGLSLGFAQNRADERVEDKYKQGHSRHGDAFDVGPRQKPWIIEGIGRTRLKVTTSNPEAQRWFDQGITLLHSFWYYEAERAFRWSLKLDPDCAMAYWGLARSASDSRRSAAFIKEAAKRKDKVGKRERMYIDAWEALYGPGDPKDPNAADEGNNRKRERFKLLLEAIVLEYPDDLEAKSLFALENLRNSRYGTELILQEVLAKDPNHPGAHHYRIHNWDDEDGFRALDSCRVYGKIASRVGHAQHMPGHIFSGIGMWHEAAIAMDSATRVEKDYMRQRMTLPFNNWNYAHNKNYLGFILEQLGLADAAVSGARQLLAAPRDPKYDDPNQYGTHWQGTIAMMRALIKFERWNEILAPGTFSWGENVRDRMHKAYCETLAHLGLGDRDRAHDSYAVHAGLHGEIQKPENQWLERTYSVQSLETRALLALDKGDDIQGLALLATAAEKEMELREGNNDPPSYPNALYNTLGRAYLDRRSPALAAGAFEKTLEFIRNDGFALSGLVEAYAALGEKDKARDAYARLLHVWSEADADLKPLLRARAVGIDAEPRDSSPGEQRNYRKITLDQFGPNVWEPYPAPELAALDAKGERVKLEDYRGSNVLIIFYLGGECPHCMEQLVEVARRRSELEGLNTKVLAISSDPPEVNSKSVKTRDLPFRLLSDKGYENARRFKSYDDFEEMELHSTILVDSQGRVHWSRHGGDPFTDFEFLTREIRRLNEGSSSRSGN